jgi:hypothetical protein
MFGLGLGLADAVVVMRRGTGGGLVHLALAISRPPFAMAEAWNLWGDSTTFGFGAPGGSDYSQVLRAMAAAGGGAPAGRACRLGAPSDGTRTGVCNGDVAGQNMVSIAGRVATLANGAFAVQMQRPRVFSGGLNNYNGGVAGWSRNWPEQVSPELAGAAARIGGGRDWFHSLAPAEDNRCDGMIEGCRTSIIAAR